MAERDRLVLTQLSKLIKGVECIIKAEEYVTAWSKKALTKCDGKR